MVEQGERSALARAWLARFKVLMDHVYSYADDGDDWWDCPRCGTPYTCREDAAWCAATDCFEEAGRG